jgi:Trypsin
MRKRIVLFFSALVLALTATAGVQAITFGENDNGRHPFVGSLVGDFQGNTFQLCSGTMVSSTVFVTAGHCIVGLEDFGVTNLGVTFDEVIDADANGRVDSGVTVHRGTGHIHPDWGFPGAGGNAADPHDVGVLVLRAPVTMDQYGQLPTAGLLDTVDKRSTRFTTVG